MARGNNVLEIIINGTNRAGPAFKQAAVQATRMGAAVSTALAAATVRAGQFEKGLAEISTLLDGDVTQSIQQIRGELLDLSTEFGQSIGKMTKARYDVISAGFTDAAESATVLRSASKLAVAGVSDVAVAADLLTSALGGLQLDASESERIINVLFQTVRKGKTTLDQLGQGLGKVFGTAKIAKVSLEELGAVMATATASGVQTAEAVTGLNALLLALSAPTEEAKQALADAGIDMKKGLLQTLIDINAAAGESPAKMRELIPSIEALRVASVVAGNLGLMTENLESMGASAGVVDEGVAKMAQTFDFQLQRAKRSLDALVIEVGTAFLPAATDMLENLNLLAKGFREGDTDIQGMAKTIGKWALGVTAAGVALSTLSSAVTIIGPAIAGMGAFFLAASGPIQATMIAIFATVAALIKYRKEIEENLFPMADKFRDENDKMAESTNPLVTGMKRLALAAGAITYGQMAHDANNLSKTLDKMGFPDAADEARDFRDAMGGLSTVTAQLADGPAADIDNAFVEGFEGAKDAAEEGMDDILKTVTDSVGEMLSEIQETFNAMTRLQKKAEDIVSIPAPKVERQPEGPDVGPDFKTMEERWEAASKADAARREEREKAEAEAEQASLDRIANIQEQVASLAEFTAEDFIGMAFNIGAAFANVATQIAGHLFGLTKGPLMLGRAFKQMAVSILGDLAQIIARMLVARALMSAFGGGGFLGGVFSSLGGFGSPAGVPTAASGFSVPGGSGQLFPPIILPGSSGLDRRPVLAAGGEAIISKPHVNAMQAAIKQPQTSPRRGSGGRGGGRGMTVKVDLQANRPFRRSEQVELTDSVTEGIERSARYGS